MLSRLFNRVREMLQPKAETRDPIGLPQVEGGSYVLVLRIGGPDWDAESSDLCAQAVGDHGCLWHEADPDPGDPPVRLAFVLASDLPAIAGAAWELAKLESGVYWEEGGADA